MKLVDTHCHLDYDFAPKTASDLVREAELAGVGALITIGTDTANAGKLHLLSEQFPNVFHTVGVHPHEASTVEDLDLDSLRAAAKHPKCRAIGEIGLDYYYEHSPKDAQIQRCEDQLALALELKLPIVVHSREGEADLLPMLRSYASRSTASGGPGIIHCFTGTGEFGRACLDLGFLISFSGILTFKKSEDLRAQARAFPLDRLLVETDSPYLAPMPMRGKKCEPSMVKYTALHLAEVKGVSIDEVTEKTSTNAARIFNLPAELLVSNG